MTIDALAAWLLSAMISWNPPAQHREGEKVAQERYASMAQDFASVALDAEEPPLFEGPTGRAQTALLVASVASSESGYRRDVDSGATRGDHGRSWCILQVQVYGHTPEKWTGEELVQDRKRCIRAGLHRMRESFAACKSLPLLDRLSGYLSGSCHTDGQSEYRTRRALSWWKKHPLEAGG